MTRRVAAREWISSYERSWLGPDIVGGLTVAAVLIPSALAYSGIVGVEPIVGLYTVPPALVAYAIFGGSRLLVVGPDAAISVLAASTVAVAVADGATYLDAVIVLTLVSGGIYLLMHLLRMGWIADLVPRPVVRGFIQGLVWVTILDQLPKLLGLDLVDDDRGFFRRLTQVLGAIGDIDAATALLGVGSLLALIGFRTLAPRVPGPLIVLAASMILVGVAWPDGDGVTVVGNPTGPLLDLGVPTDITLQQALELVPGALAIVILGFTQTMGAATSAAATTGERLDPDRELFALGTANLGAGLAGGYVVGGTLSKTSVAISAGGRTQVGNLVAAAVGLVSLFVLRPVFDQLALTVLAAIVIFAMAGMADVAYFARLWKISRREFTIALLAFGGVLVTGVLPGVIVAVVAALLLVVHHVGRPPAYELGRSPTGDWHDLDHDDVQTRPGLAVWRQEGPLLFLNARRYCQGLVELADAGARVIVIDASVTSGVDSTGLQWFVETWRDLADRGVEVWLVAPLDRPLARAQRIAGEIGAELPPVITTLDAALARFDERARHEVGATTDDEPPTQPDVR